MRLALYQPDIPPNTGTLLRLGACLGVPVDVIEPCGFPFSDRDFRRAGLDYLERVDCRRHASWAAFLAQQLETPGGRLVLLTTKADLPYTVFQFQPSDTILVGRETSGAPDEVHRAADQRVVIPMVAGIRSLNVALAAAIVLAEALRQTGALPSVTAPIAKVGR
ncbi:MAG: tRNA (cytidine(34)-2'-O)-methyltransferase [Alphaproteobacteria bacterium]|nr:tRNA (cytidine(34)-2'-O)-methyltransferase [Alphaproteobacteria bacterium]